MEFFEANVQTKTKSVIKAFSKTLKVYKDNYGEDNIQIIDSCGNVIHAIREVEDSELIELTTLNDENNLILRLIHYSQFDLTIKTSKY